MEVASTNRSGSRLPQSALKNLSLSSSQPDSTFEMLLDMPTVSASYIKPTAGDTQSVDEATASISESSETKKKPREEKKDESSEEPQNVADPTAANLAAASVQAPNTQCNLPRPDVAKDSDKKNTAAISQDVQQTQAAQPTDKVAEETTTASSKFELGEDQQVKEPSPGTAQELKPVAEKVDPSNAAGPVKKVERGHENSDDHERSQKPESIVPEQKAQGKKDNDKSQVADQKLNIDPKANSQVQAQPIEQTHKEQQDHDRPAKWYERDAKDAGDNKSDVTAALDTKSKDAVANPEASKTQDAAPVTVDPAANVNVVASEVTATPDSAAIPTLAMLESQSTVGIASSGPASTGSASVDSSTASVSSGRTVPPGLQRAAGAGSATATTGSDPSQPNQPVDVSRAEKARLVQRVARSFSRVGPMGGNVNLKLHPPELGALAVQVKIEGKSMSAKLTTESSAARDVILESLPQLRSRLAEQGYDVQQFTVDVASDGAALSNQTGQGGAGQGSGAWFGGQSGDSSDSSSRSAPPTDLRRSSYLRRQLDSVGSATRPTNQSFGGRGVDITA